MLTSLLTLSLAAAACLPGQAITPDTAGQCCWSSQVWSKLQKRCVGVPACPSGMQAQGETCVVSCPAGQLVSEDTRGQCCWPNQVWSVSRNVCVGVPACPAGYAASGETCAPGTAVQPAPPPQQPQYAPPPNAPPPQQPQYAQPQPQYAQPQPQYAPPPPQYAPPPPADAPRADPPAARERERAALQARLVEQRQRHASITFGGEIAMLIIGASTLPFGVWMFVTGFGGRDTALGVLGLVITCVAFPMTLIGVIGLPSKAQMKGKLGKEIRATEAELRAFDARARLLSLPAPQGLAFSLSSPVFTF